MISQLIFLLSSSTSLFDLICIFGMIKDDDCFINGDFFINDKYFSEGTYFIDDESFRCDNCFVEDTFICGC